MPQTGSMRHGASPARSSRIGQSGTTIAVAVLHELMERAPHRLQLLNLLIELVDVVLGDTADVGARAPAVAPQAEQLLDLLHRKARVAGRGG